MCTISANVVWGHSYDNVNIKISFATRKFPDLRQGLKYALLFIAMGLAL